MTTIEKSTEGGAKGGNDSQNNDFFYLDNSHHDPQRQEVQVVHLLK